MEVKILQLIDGARQAMGLAVIIDVFRAFSVACYVVGGGAWKIIPVGSLETAYRLKESNPHYILMGERRGRIQQGFDYGNSPTKVNGIDFTGKTIIQTTSAGTQGLVSATGASEIITGSFVNAGAVVEYLRRRRPQQVSLVAMGTEGREPADEDLLCARYLKNALENKKNDFPGVVEHLKKCSSAKKFFDPRATWAPKKDFYLCLALNRFPFVLRATGLAEGCPVLTPYYP